MAEGRASPGTAIKDEAGTDGGGADSAPSPSLGPSGLGARRALIEAGFSSEPAQQRALLAARALIQLHLPEADATTTAALLCATEMMHAMRWGDLAFGPPAAPQGSGAEPPLWLVDAEGRAHHAALCLVDEALPGDGGGAPGIAELELSVLACLSQAVLELGLRAPQALDMAPTQAARRGARLSFDPSARRGEAAPFAPGFGQVLASALPDLR